MTVDLTVLNLVITAIVGYYALLFGLAFRRRPAPAGQGPLPLVVVVVPARDEEVVLDETVRSLLAQEYAGELRVLVVDDGSTDATGHIAEEWCLRETRVRVLHRVPPEAALGKSEALNHAYLAIDGWHRTGDAWFGGRDRSDIVVAIVDADGRLAPGAVRAVAPYFAADEVGSVQIGVQISNVRDGLLARMQDIEFVGFTWLVQIARDWLGSSGLGGNGQFTRLGALDSLGARPWRPGALTEDLDLGIRLVERGWRTRFCHQTHVSQQGLNRWRPLLRQRTRWIQGHYQCWSRIPTLVSSRKVSLITRLDLTLYLLLVVTVLLVGLTVVLALLSLGPWVTVENRLLHLVPFGPPRRAVSLLVALLPLTLFMGTYQLRSSHPFRWYEVPAAGVAFTCYGYVWLWVSLRALLNLALGRRTWAKTPRVVETAALPSNVSVSETG